MRREPRSARGLKTRETSTRRREKRRCEKDEKRSTKLRPFYSHANPQPIVPGEVLLYEIEVMPCAHRFKAGHRIRLEIVNGDSPLTDSLFTHQYLYYKVGSDTIWHNAKRPSRLLLPVVPAK